MKIQRSVRRSQYVTSSGVGAIFENAQESLIAWDTTSWPNFCETMFLPRLQAKIGAPGGFRKPPVKSSPFQKDPPKLRYLRFPRWLFCPNCRRMKQWTARDEIEIEKAEELPRCRLCATPRPILVPMRFVAVCPDGHLSDINWFKWAHSTATVERHGQCSYQEMKLKFITRPGFGSALRSMQVACDNCKAKRDLGEIMLPEKIREAGIFCSGRQPWQAFDPSAKCSQMVRGEQRSSSNIYYAVSVSALDIPAPDEEEGKDLTNQIESHGTFPTLKQIFTSSGEGAKAPAVIGVAQIIANDLQLDLDEVLNHLAPNSGSIDSAPLDNEQIERDLLREEWPALQRETDDSKIVVRREPRSNETELGQKIASLIEQVMLVEKLREVRVFRGFNRLIPKATFTPPDLTGQMSWLPGIDVFGEGIFLKFSEAKIQEWLATHEETLLHRLEKMVERYENADGLTSLLPRPSARFVMLHTFSHLLIRQLCFNCGYGSASLRERVYSSDTEGKEMAGILIYTADSDAEGSLGGLVREGRSDRLVPTIAESLAKSIWCSSDPICRELPGQGLNGLNRAACHACALVSETSCLFHNALLDRVLVLGDGTAGPRGFFSEILSI